MATQSRAQHHSSQTAVHIGLVTTVFALLLTAVALTPAQATDVASATYAVNEDGLTARVTGCVSPCAGVLTINDEYLGKPVTIVESSAFHSESDLTGTLVIPDSVETIEGWAFVDTGFTGLSLGSQLTSIGDWAFAGTSPMKLSGSLTIPNSVTSIGSGAFSYATELTSLNLGNSLETIGTGAFMGSSSVPMKLTGTLTIPDSVTTIGNNAFYNTVNLTGLTLGTSLTNIGNSAFAASTEAMKLTGTLTIPDSVKAIGSNAFSRASNLDAVRFLGDVAPTFGTAQPPFRNSGTTPLYRKATATGTWPELNDSPIVAVDLPTFTTSPASTSVVVGEEVVLDTVADSHVGGGTLTFEWFKGGTKIVGATNQTLSIPTASVEDSGSYTVRATGWAGRSSSNPATVTVTPAYAVDTAEASYTVNPDGVTSRVTGCETPCTGVLTIHDTYENTSVVEIANNAFTNTTGLTGTLTIPDSVEAIGAWNFNDAFELSGLELGSSLTSIGDHTFTNLRGVAGTLTLPNSVERIGEGAFYNATKLTGLTLSDSLTHIGGGAFCGTAESMSLTGILTIPKNVDYVGYDAFCGSSRLSGVRFLSDKAPEFGSSPFWGSGTIPFYRKALATGTWPAINGSAIALVDAPTVTSPESKTVTDGQAVTLSATATSHTDGGTLTYQWLRNGVAVPGATSSTLVIANAAITDSGSYSLQATGWAGTGVSQHPGEVTVRPKASQSTKLRLPATLKKGKKYALPRSTVQGQRLTWKPAKSRYCSIKKQNLRCTKVTEKAKNKKVVITATAPGTSTLKGYTKSFTRKVK